MSAPHDARPGALCRDCDWWVEGPAVAPARCPSCGSPRTLAHPLLFSLSIAHVDCDAFYAAVELRDAPELAGRPLIIGGGRRGVVTTACYLARAFGVRSAMPMFKAQALCPQAVVVKPTMAKYVEASRAVRNLFDALTPLVEPLSLDEAFLDLTGTERLHGAPPAVRLARLARDVMAEVGVPVSIGLAPNKFLAKIASDLDKPKGYRPVGQTEAARLLAPKPTSAIWGVGPAFAKKLERAGFATVAHLQSADPAALAAKFGDQGARLARLARGEDARTVGGGRPKSKSVSAETTFTVDLARFDELEPALWRLSERVAARLKAGGLAGRVVTLKLKNARFKVVTRRRTMETPFQRADPLFRAVRPMLAGEVDAGGGPWRLLGVGAFDVSARDAATDSGDLLDPDAQRRARAEDAMDSIKARFGDGAIDFGRASPRRT